MCVQCTQPLKANVITFVCVAENISSILTFIASNSRPSNLLLMCECVCVFSYRFTLAIDVLAKKKNQTQIKQRNKSNKQNAPTDNVSECRADFLLTKTDYRNVSVNNYEITFVNHYNEYGLMFDFQLGEPIDMDMWLFMSISKFNRRRSNGIQFFPYNKNTYVCMLLIYIDYIQLIS